MYRPMCCGVFAVLGSFLMWADWTGTRTLDAEQASRIVGGQVGSLPHGLCIGYPICMENSTCPNNLNDCPDASEFSPISPDSNLDCTLSSGADACNVVGASDLCVREVQCRVFFETSCVALGALTDHYGFDNCSDETGVY
jgi:hypothetical protein